jgi:hypothetical protein
MKPVKLQILKFQAEKSCQVGFNVLQRLYLRAFVKRVKSFIHVSELSVCMYCHCADLLVAFLERRKPNALNAFYNF